MNNSTYKIKWYFLISIFYLIEIAQSASNLVVTQTYDFGYKSGITSQSFSSYTQFETLNGGLFTPKTANVYRSGSLYKTITINVSPSKAYSL